MTWLGDENKKVTGAAREKLEADRAALVKQIEVLGIAPLRSATRAAALGRQEDLLALAKKVKVIDKKLGREVS